MAVDLQELKEKLVKQNIELSIRLRGVLDGNNLLFEENQKFKQSWLGRIYLWLNKTK